MTLITKYYLLLLLLITLGFSVYYCFFSPDVHTKNKIEYAYNSQINWFINNQNPENNFPYEITTSTQKIATRSASASESATVRQLLSLHTLSLIYEKDNEPRLKETIENGITYYQKFLIREEFIYNNTQIFTQRVTIDDYDDFNNSTPFLLLTLLEFTSAEPNKKDQYQQQISELGNYLVSIQLPSGGFKYRPSDPAENTYNNGEAFYALVRLSRESADKKYVVAAEKAAQYFLTKYSTFNPQFFNWGMRGFSELSNIHPNEEYWTFMKNQNDQFLEQRGKIIENYLYQKIPPAPTFDIVSYIEGTLQVASKAKDRGESEYYNRLITLAEESLTYLTDFQINGPNNRYTSSSLLLNGSMCTNQTCATTRVDMTGHTLSALFYYLKLKD